MRSLDSQARKEVIKQMSYCFVPKDKVLFNQGSIGNYFYIIKSGRVNLLIDDVNKKTLRHGDSFGELALLHGALRSGTIKTCDDAYMWCLERKKFKQVVDYINNKHFEENRLFIQTIPIINNLESSIVTMISSNVIQVIYDPGNYIVKEGESADCIFLIKEGTVQCSKRDEIFRTLTKGDFFGMTAVLLDSPRSMNVIAKTTVVCYSLSVGTLVNILGNNFKDILYMNFIKMAMKNSKLFSKINSNLIDATFPNFKIYKFDRNQVAFKKGSAITQKIIVIIEGNLAFTNEYNEFEYMERGKVLFEDDILKTRDSNLFNNDDETCYDMKSKNNSIRLGRDLVADPDCLLVMADFDEFTKTLGGSLQEVSEKSNLIDSLMKVPLFKNFTQNKLNSFINHVEIENYSKGEAIIREGEDGSKFYIVKQGKIDIFVKNNYIRSLNDYEFFGERSLFIKEPRSATAIAAENVSLYVLSKDIFKNLEDNLKDYILKRIALQDNTVELSDLDYISTLGKGNFGNVYLVKCRKNECYYALKSISKTQIDQEQLHCNLDMERKILLQIDHPFIMKLVKSLKDDDNIYFLTEYIRGKELWDVIRDIGLLNKSQSLFYGCSMMMAVDYLHKRKFIYRDIKPENIIVTEQVK